MSTPFRDDLDAVRARAEALASENGDLKEEILRLRRERLPPDKAKESLELAMLTSNTLHRLDELDAEIDAHTEKVASEPGPEAAAPAKRRAPDAPAAGLARGTTTEGLGAVASPSSEASPSPEAELDHLRMFRARMRLIFPAALVLAFAAGAIVTAVAR